MLSFLEKIYHYYNRKEFISTDPIIYPHTIKGDIEFIAFISSIFAYGRVASINKFLKLFFDLYGFYPNRVKTKKNIYYRFQSSDDIYNFLNFLKNIFQSYGSLYDFLLKINPNDLDAAYKGFHEYYLEYFGNKLTQGLRFLLPDITKSSAKRVRMFFRWMVRKDNIDFGVWVKYDKKSLKFPLDIHILTYAYNRNIIRNKSNSYKNTLKVTDYFLKINEIDPVKYDFALTRLGMIEGCKFLKDESCKNCRWFKVCVFN
ncbi:conserved hypothetical protein [Deferribacter desulfuricans SSM1]|uniref:TIGR02757 family protein n=1 Tax=Deferribacter desulfuricans (strain DSM 14783 / JCM 11476 / NBRC 101012 / SSM1) TaxID=639282 RepID=D3PDG2_DEFDS|nr:TIGR02757 family protein [Deferribacter desulfuricans]BAI80635.1 conserved hypothetical protein [Deferribacter desulfuricans SSM1]